MSRPSDPVSAHIQRLLSDLPLDEAIGFAPEQGVPGAFQVATRHVIR